MKTVRQHSAGDTFTRTVPDGCKTKTQWAKEGMILKDGARPAAWVLMGDNLHEFAVFSPESVEPGKIERPKAVTSKQIEKAWNQLKPHLSKNYYYNLILFPEEHYYAIDWVNKTTHDEGTIPLSGSKDHNGTLNRALSRIQEMLSEILKPDPAPWVKRWLDS